ncbi:MAG TPA: hypothetical protein PLL09_04005 [Flavobacterium sp.]|uniref:hypothetical protein n=1 Tax=unclassified Flavobacterium TaxID=196869 RepID=UPI0025B99BDA|nr:MULTISPECIES: hypothetical protein [unclassified Flavobacterium]HRE76970.1 hypothetical protein [Flavobacterium sp.]
MKRINTKKFFEITASLLLFMMVSLSCIEEEEKKMTKSEFDFEIENITRLSTINLRLKLAFNQFIEKSEDSLLINMFSEFEKNHNQVDTIINSVAQKKLIVLSDVFSKKTNQFQISSENGLKDFRIFLEKEKEKLEKIRQKNKVQDLNDFYEKKIEELEQNITTINNFLETQNKPNY